MKRLRVNQTRKTKWGRKWKDTIKERNMGREKEHKQPFKKPYGKLLVYKLSKIYAYKKGI